MPNRDWLIEAACRGADSTPWDYDIPAGRAVGLPRRLYTQAAKAVCATCPVVRECVRDAVAGEDVWTIRGGLTPGERHRLGLHPGWAKLRIGYP